MKRVGGPPRPFHRTLLVLEILYSPVWSWHHRDLIRSIW